MRTLEFAASSKSEDDDDDDDDEARRTNVKNTFEVCSYIQKNTQNQNPIFKITIYNQNTPNMPKYIRIFRLLIDFFLEKRMVPTNQFFIL